MLRKNLEESKNVKTVVLLVTNACNLKCTYCYENNKCSYYMSEETMKEIVETELTADNGFDEITFNVMGGEPFLAFNLIKSLMAYLSSKDWPKAWYISLCTNGTLVHGEIKEFLLKHKDKIALSLSYDGTPASQDVNRSRSSKSVDLDFFAQHFPFIKMTISHETLPHVAEGVIFLQEKGFLVAANLALGIDWTDEGNITCFVEQLSKLSDYYLDHPGLRQCSLLDMGIETLNPLKEKVDKYCGAGAKMICYDSDGQSYPCHMFAPLSIGKEKAKQSRNLTFDQHIDYNMLNEECRNCPVIQLCPTCEGMNFDARGNVFSRDRVYCKLIKIQILANSVFKYRQYSTGQLQLSEEEEYRLLNNIRIIQTLSI